VPAGVRWIDLRKGTRLFAERTSYAQIGDISRSTRPCVMRPEVPGHSRRLRGVSAHRSGATQTVMFQGLAPTASPTYRCRRRASYALRPAVLGGRSCALRRALGLDHPRLGVQDAFPLDAFDDLHGPLGSSAHRWRLQPHRRRGRPAPDLRARGRLGRLMEPRERAVHRRREVFVRVVQADEKPGPYATTSQSPTGTPKGPGGAPRPYTVWPSFATATTVVAS
jgi:hypothetical protein